MISIPPIINKYLFQSFVEVEGELSGLILEVDDSLKL